MSTKNKKVWIALFIVPCMILFVLIYAAPIVTVLYTSLCEYTVSTSPVLKGLENFRTIFQDKDFLESIKNTLVWVVLQSTFHVSLGFIMALVLRRKPKGWKFVRTAYMIPNIIPTAATGVMFTLLLNPTFGVLKSVYGIFGLEDVYKRQEILHIDKQTLENGVPFSKAIRRFLKWCGEDVMFCTWGPSDLVELQRNMKYYRLTYLLEGPLRYYDVQKLFGISCEGDKTSRSLEYAIDHMKLDKGCLLYTSYGGRCR